MDIRSQTPQSINKSLLEITNDKLAERQKIEEQFEKNATILIQQKKLQRIDSFTGYFEFLHNNFLTPVYFEGFLYPSVTHAYHAARSSDENTRKAILNADSFHTVAKIARRIEDPQNWQMERTKIMERLVRDKFRRSKELQEKLKATENRELIMSYEDETSGNLFWGMVKEKGQNQLGRILMKVREDINNNREILNWIMTNFDLITDNNFLPEISLQVFKSNTQIEHVVFKNKSFYKIGAHEDNDLQLLHQSISRLHAVVICDKNLGVVLVDLRSTYGTKLDNDVLQDNIPYRLSDGKKINFAGSTRDYIVKIDMTKIKKVYEREKLKLEDERKILREMQEVVQKGDINSQDQKKLDDIIKKSFKLDAKEKDTVFVSNIPFKATESGLIKLFEEQFGPVKNILWPNDRETGLKKNFAFFQFKNLDNAKEAVDYGIIAYETDEGNQEFDEFDPSGNNLRHYKSSMMKIKFAEDDKFKPNFASPRSRNDRYPSERDKDRMRTPHSKSDSKNDLEKDYREKHSEKSKYKDDDRKRHSSHRKESKSHKKHRSHRKNESRRDSSKKKSSRHRDRDSKKDKHKKHKKDRDYSSDRSSVNSESDSQSKVSRSASKKSDTSSDIYSSDNQQKRPPSSDSSYSNSSSVSEKIHDKEKFSNKKRDRNYNHRSSRSHKHEKYDRPNRSNRSDSNDSRSSSRGRKKYKH
jgi:ribA/ribD-fused uncharacterized protein